MLSHQKRTLSDVTLLSHMFETQGLEKSAFIKFKVQFIRHPTSDVLIKNSSQLPSKNGNTSCKRDKIQHNTFSIPHIHQ